MFRIQIFSKLFRFPGHHFQKDLGYKGSKGKSRQMYPKQDITAKHMDIVVEIPQHYWLFRSGISMKKKDESSKK